MRIAYVTAAIAVTLGSAAASAQTAAVRLEWRVTEPAAAAGPSAVKKSDALPFARIAPQRLVRLGADATNRKGSALRAAGTPLAWSMLGGHIACEPRLQKYLSFMCFEDADGDGRFEGYALIDGIVFRARGTDSYEFLLGTFPLPPRKPLAAPVAAIADDAAYPPLDLALAFTSQWGLKGLNYFALCIFVNTGKDFFGGTTNAKYCFPQTGFKDSDLPATQSMQGGSVTVTSVQKAVATVDIKPPPVGQILD